MRPSWAPTDQEVQVVGSFYIVPFASTALHNCPCESVFENGGTVVSSRTTRCVHGRKFIFLGRYFAFAAATSYPHWSFFSSAWIPREIERLAPYSHGRQPFKGGYLTFPWRKCGRNSAIIKTKFGTFFKNKFNTALGGHNHNRLLECRKTFYLLRLIIS